MICWVILLLRNTCIQLALFLLQQSERPRKNHSSTSQESALHNSENMRLFLISCLSLTMYIDKYFRRQIVRKLCLAQKMTNLTYYVKILSIIQKPSSIWGSREGIVLAVLSALNLEFQTISWSVWKYTIRRAALLQKKPFTRRSVWANSCKLLRNINSLLLVMRLNQRDTKISQLLWRWISKELNGRLLDISL